MVVRPQLSPNSPTYPLRVVTPEPRNAASASVTSDVGGPPLGGVRRKLGDACGVVDLDEVGRVVSFCLPKVYCGNLVFVNTLRRQIDTSRIG